MPGLSPAVGASFTDTHISFIGLRTAGVGALSALLVGGGGLKKPP